jgi:hypothetical protein
MDWYKKQEVKRLVSLAADPTQSAAPTPNPIQQNKMDLVSPEQSRPAGDALSNTVWIQSLAQDKFTREIVKEAIARALNSYNIEQQSKTKNRQQMITELQQMTYLESEATFFARQIAVYIKSPGLLSQINEVTKMLMRDNDASHMSKVLIDRFKDEKSINSRDFYILGFAMENFKDSHRQQAAVIIYKTIESVINELPKNILDKINKIKTTNPQNAAMVKRVAQDFLDAVSIILKNPNLFPKDMVNVVNSLKASPINKWLKTLNPKDIYGPTKNNNVSAVPGYGATTQSQAPQTPQA